MTQNNPVLNFPVQKKNSGDYSNEINCWDLSEQLDIQFVLEHEWFKNFEKCAEVVSAKDKKCGYDIIITNDKFVNRGYVLYLLVIHGKVLKGGKVKASINKRTYYAGTEESWVERGTPSEPNYYFSQIFRSCLEKNIPVEFYGLLAPVQEQTYNFMGNNITQLVSPYEECEVIMRNNLERLKGGNLIGEGNLTQKYKK